MELWVGDHPAKAAYYKKTFGEPKLRPEWQQYADELKTDPAAMKQRKLKKENKCRDFEWFDKHIMHKLTGRHHPWYNDMGVDLNETSVNCGQHRAKTCKRCPKGHGQTWCNGDCVWCDSTQQCMDEAEHSKHCAAKKKTRGKR